MGGEKFTGHPPKSRFGEASLPVKIPVTDGSFGSIFIDLTKKVIFASGAFRSSQAEAVFGRKIMIHASIVLFGIWLFFCESHAPVDLV